MYTVLMVQVRPNLTSVFCETDFSFSCNLFMVLPSAMAIFIGIGMTVAIATYIAFADAVAIVIVHT